MKISFELPREYCVSIPSKDQPSKTEMKQGKIPSANNLDQRMDWSNMNKSNWFYIDPRKEKKNVLQNYQNVPQTFGIDSAQMKVDLRKTFARSIWSECRLRNERMAGLINPLLLLINVQQHFHDGPGFSSAKYEHNSQDMFRSLTLKNKNRRFLDNSENNHTRRIPWDNV